MRKNPQLPDDAKQVVGIWRWKDENGQDKIGIQIDFSYIFSFEDSLECVDSLLDSFAHNAALNDTESKMPSIETKKLHKVVMVKSLMGAALMGRTRQVNNYEEIKHKKPPKEGDSNDES